MKTKLQFGTHLSRWLSVLLWMAAFLLGGTNEMRADDTYIWVKRTTIDRDNAWTDVWLHCGEDEYGTYSYWYDNPVVKIDGVKVATFKDLGIPTLASEGSKKNVMSKLESLRPYNDVYKVFKANEWITICMWDPQLNSDKDNYHMCMDIHMGWNPEGKAHKIEIVGKWVNNDGSPYSKTLSWTCNATSVGVFPNSVSASRNKNGKVKVSWSSKVGTYTGFTNKMHIYNLSNNIPANFNAPNPLYQFNISSSQTTQEINVDNYKGIILYPTIFHSMEQNTNWYQWRKDKSWTNWFKNYGGIKINGYPKANNVNVTTTNSYTKEIKVTWDAQINDKNSVDTNGKWYIFRRMAGDSKAANTKKLGEVNYDATKEFTYTLTDNDYGVNYNYIVCFVPNGWTAKSENDATNLSSNKEHTMVADFAFSNVQAIPTKNDITLTWDHSKILDANSSKQYVFRVERSLDLTNWTEIGQVTVTDPNVSSGQYTDKSDVLEAYATYYYRISSFIQNDTRKAEINSQLDGTTKVTSFTASRGVYNNTVKLQWNVEQVGSGTTYFIVQRRLLGSSNDKDWADIYSTQGVSSMYSYDDVNANPGTFYEYRVLLWSIYQDKPVGKRNTDTDGFSLSTGVLSGRIYYDSGTAVEGTKVILRPSGTNGEDVSLYRSLRLNGGMTGSGMTYKGNEGDISSAISSDFSIQLYVKPDGYIMNEEGKEYVLADLAGKYTIYIKYNVTDKTYTLGASAEGAAAVYSNVSIPADKWSHVTMTHSGTGNTTLFYVTTPGDVKTSDAITTLSASITEADCTITLGNKTDLEAADIFAGNVDEFRVFSKVLTANEIERNYNHPLTGSETGLFIYWPMDEKLGMQTLAYDFSRTNGLINGRYASMRQPSESSTDIPDEDQFSLCGYTDADGNYIINGIPFSGDGLNYSVVPTMGIHSFSPSASSRYFSLNSLVHSGLDFKDISSFPVDGNVYYENTTIPVSEAYVYVDGIVASKDGEPVMTDAEGHYVVDVPIGDHFIQIKKNGHTFTNNGRYPSDPNSLGLRETFEAPITGLTFWDETKVMVAGRVAGGSVEESKPLGLQQGTANIGRATIKLTFPGSESGNFINAKKEVTGTAIAYVQSDEQRNFSTGILGGKAYVEANSNVLTIETDSTTGEFAAYLPPLYYETTEITIPTQQEIVFTNKPVLDATSPDVVYTDSIEDENGKRTFDYVAAARIIYRSPSHLEVTENENGSFGMDSITVKDINDKSEKVALYTINNEDKTINYPFGAPVYQMLGRYTYHLYAYESYTNKEVEGSPVTVKVPIPNSRVTVKNQFASTTTVAEDNGAVAEISNEEFNLDEEGKADYTFICGLPNIQSPYTRTLNISYEVNDEAMEWDGNGTFKAVVLGTLSTGTNFVTEGPDKVTMVLRDPPGSLSKTTYSTGTEVTSVSTYNKTTVENAGVQSDIYMGCSMQTGGGFGFIALSELDAKNTLSVGADYTHTWNSVDQNTTVTTLTKEISTSDGTDFVGSGGDVFIGTSNNLVFGTCHNVSIKKNETDGTYSLVMTDGVSMGEQFKTDFNYTQNYVENVLIPNFESLRNGKLTKVADVSSVSAPTGDEPIYVTTLSEDDERFGSDNDDKEVWGGEAKKFVIKNGRYTGPSYTMILPADFSATNTSKDSTKTGVQDMVKHYNEQIRLWQDQLRFNEEQKVKAMNDRGKYLDKNYSFDAGAVVTSTIETLNSTTTVKENTNEVNVILSNETGFSVCGVGLGVTIHSNTQHTMTNTSESSTTSTTSTSFTLQEDGDDDYLSVDVFKAPDGFGPIFVTRAGATCAPYEDEVVTKYYEPGTIISHKTQQIEKPEIEIVDAIVTGVPGGEDAKFRVALRNNSDTQEDCYFGLRVEANSNSDGAQVYVDGQNLGSNPVLLIPYGETIKTFSLRQSDLDVLDYENIEITMYSTSQPDDTGVFPGIYSTGTVNVHFQPACSNVILATNKTVVNTSTKNDVVLSMSGYDYSMASFRDIRLQYKGIHDSDFRTLQEYTKDENRLASDKNLKELKALTGTDKLTFALDMTDNSMFTDQTYVFRAVAVCIKGSGEVTRASEEVEIIRDLSLPQLLSTPTPQSGVLYPGDDISITFNEPIRNDLLAKLNNFKVVGVKNEGEVAHSVGLKINDQTQASTEAAINLDGRSFAMGMWLKYSADGTLLQHGTKDNGMTVSINEGKLAVDINGKTVTSDVALPKDKWLYLMLSLDQDRDDARLDARYAEDTQTTDLFYSYIGAYNGNGKLAIGGNALTGAMQEMTLWNKALPLDELQGSMHQVKNNCTDGLAGYWRFDEGHGSVAADIVRNRHIMLDSESAWWKNFTNYALTSGGKLDVSALGFNDNDDFVMETWMNADQQQADGDVYVIANKPSKLALRIDSDRRLQFDYNGKSAQVTDEAVNDNQWHHIAVAVNHSSNGYAKIYVDGKLRTQVPAQEVYAPRGESLYLASYEDGETTSRMQGCIDEVRIWKGQRSATVINDWMYRRANGGEDMLALHLPFETITINEYNQAVTVPSYTNTIDNKVLTPTGSETLAATADNVPALNEAETLENINYSFVANENQVTFHIEEQPAAVEGRTVTFTARNIQDLNGNSNSPVTWNVLVKQANLKWNEETVAEVQPYGDTNSFTAEISNTGIITENWVLSGVPSWLDVSSESGSLPALKNMTLKFTPQAGMAIGKYEATVMLTGSQGISQPLHVSLYVKGQAPDWTATPDETNMNLIGQLKVNGVISSDTDDMLAAFRAGKCVGVAHPKYLSKYDSYIVMMDIYGNQNVQDNTLEYKMYDASTGTVYPLVGASDTRALTYVADTWIGSFETPVTFTPENKIEQAISCDYEGWKWFSLFAKPESMEIMSVFAHSDKAIAVIKDEKSSAYCEDGLWSGSLKSLSLNGMFKLKTLSAFSEAYLGTPAEDENSVITLAKGWTWLGYPVSIANSLNNALAGADPQEGDMIKGQSGFAIYTDNQWIGSLGMMTPGMGYQYYSNADATKSFTFPKVNVSTSARAASIADETLQLDCESNMTMIAVVKNGDFAVDNATVSVYADGRLCGRSSAPVIGDKHFITIGGNGKSMLTFVVETPSATTQLSQMLTFSTDARLGSIDEPYELQMSDITVINRIESDLSDVTLLEVIDNAGRVVRKTANPTALPALDKSEYHSADIYNIRLTYRSGETKVFRLTM